MRRFFVQETTIIVVEVNEERQYLQVGTNLIGLTTEAKVLHRVEKHFVRISGTGCWKLTACDSLKKATSNTQRI